MHENLGARGWSRLAAGIAAVVMASGLALAASASASASATSVPVKIDINAATKVELAKLPGIGDAYSQKIIDGRPYKTKTELESKKILPKSVYDKIAPLIIAHQK